MTGAIGFGVTYVNSESKASVVLSGSVPARTSAALRSLSGTVDSTSRMKAYHLELRGQFGGKRGEAVLFAGPSIVDVPDGFSAISIQEATSNGNGAFSAASISSSQPRRRVGANGGLDLSAFPTAPIGLGIGVRFVFSQDQGTTPSAKVWRNWTYVTIGLRLRL